MDIGKTTPHLPTFEFAQPPASSYSPSVILTRADLRALGIPFSNSHLLRLEFLGRFPRRLRLAGSTVAWDREEVVQWIKARKAERADWRYADPF